MVETKNRTFFAGGDRRCRRCDQPLPPSYPQDIHIGESRPACDMARMLRRQQMRLWSERVADSCRRQLRSRRPIDRALGYIQLRHETRDPVWIVWAWDAALGWHVVSSHADRDDARAAFGRLDHA